MQCPFANVFHKVTLFASCSGEPLLNLPPLIKYPWYDEASGYQLLPFKTISMLISLVATILASLIATFLFKKRILPYSLDICDCFQEKYNVSKFNMNNYNSDGNTGKTNPAFISSDHFVQSSI